MASNRVNSLSLNVDNVMSQIRAHYIKAFARAEDRFLEIMEREALASNVGNGPGKPAWRQDLSDSLKVVEETFTDKFLEAKVGFDATGMFTSFVKAMLISEGAGSAAGGSPITAGPPGRIVWDDNLDGKHPSNAKSEYLMPAGWNQPGNHFVENAVKLMKKHFDDVIEEASQSLPSFIFYGNVNVSG